MIKNTFKQQEGGLFYFKIFSRLRVKYVITYRQTTAFLFSPALQKILARAMANASVLSSQDGSLLYDKSIKNICQFLSILTSLDGLLLY